MTCLDNLQREALLKEGRRRHPQKGGEVHPYKIVGHTVLEVYVHMLENGLTHTLTLRGVFGTRNCQVISR